MRIAVTGATGFIGRHFVAEAFQRGHSILAVCRSKEAAKSLGWPSAVDVVEVDIGDPPQAVVQLIAASDACVHLAWGGLTDFRSLRHVEIELPQHFAFLSALRKAGLRRLVVAGTCLEYGLKWGPLQEDTPTNPVTAYGLAKDTLRRMLEFQNGGGFTLLWARLFYLYGEMAGRRTLLMQLKEAVSRGDATFPMSLGEQLRDFLPVNAVAARLLALAVHPDAQGVFNVCSGSPISVRRLVEQWIGENGWRISLELGRYPYPDYEPLAFWGDSSRIDTVTRRT